MHSIPGRAKRGSWLRVQSVNRCVPLALVEIVERFREGRRQFASLHVPVVALDSCHRRLRRFVVILKPRPLQTLQHTAPRLDYSTGGFAGCGGSGDGRPDDTPGTQPHPQRGHERRCGHTLERAARPTDTLLCMHATRSAAESRLRRRGPNAPTLLRRVGAGEAHR